MISHMQLVTWSLSLDNDPVSKQDLLATSAERTEAAITTKPKSVRYVRDTHLVC